MSYKYAYMKSQSLVLLHRLRRDIIRHSLTFNVRSNIVYGILPTGHYSASLSSCSRKRLYSSASTSSYFLHLTSLPQKLTPPAMSALCAFSLFTVTTQRLGIHILERTILLGTNWILTTLVSLYRCIVFSTESSTVL